MKLLLWHGGVGGGVVVGTSSSGVCRAYSVAVIAVVIAIVASESKGER